MRSVMVSAIIGVLLLSGCCLSSVDDSETEQNVSPQPVPAPPYSGTGQTVETTVGKEFTISLEANPTTGYKWEVDFGSSFLDLVASEFRQAAARPGMVGVGGEQRFTFRALQAGTTTVQFTYKRPWEQGVADERTFIIHIK